VLAVVAVVSTVLNVVVLASVATASDADATSWTVGAGALLKRNTAKAPAAVIAHTRMNKRIGRSARALRPR
jgi:hypothetical protein